MSRQSAAARGGRCESLAAGMRIHRRVLLFVCAFAVLFVRCTQAVGDSSGSQTKQAYVSLLYGNFYVLPLRTLMRSLLENSRDVASGLRERVVIVTGSTSKRTISELESDGIKVLRIPTVRTPYMEDPRFDKRFASVMTKLAIFNLTQYERLAFVDADALILRDMSDLFSCGRFCAVFINPCHFNSGLMIVSPSTQTFNDMLEKLPLLPSYDGGDQGFLNSYYPQMLAAPMYDPADRSVDTSDMDFVRLPFTYHMDHSAFYSRLRWDHSTARCGGEMREEEWLGPSFAKPWLWYTYAVLDQSWKWHEYRQKLSNPYPQGTQTEKSAIFLILLSYVCCVPLLFFSRNFHNMMATTLPSVSPFGSLRRRYSILAVLALGTLIWTLSFGVAFSVVPPLVPPVLAFVTFVHVRWLVEFPLLVLAFGSMGCCGQNAMRGTVKSFRTPEGHALNSSLRGCIRISAIWSVVDTGFLGLCLAIMWKIKFSVLAERLVFISVSVLAQMALTCAMLLHLSLVWFRWGGTLPPLARTSGSWR